jgi:hypothetical protein
MKRIIVMEQLDEQFRDTLCHIIDHLFGMKKHLDAIFAALA